MLNLGEKVYTELVEGARKLMLDNFEATGGKYITPAWPYYQHQWLWDSAFHAVICAELGLKDLAKNEVERFLGYQQKSGWIPHTIYHGRRTGILGFWEGLERSLYKKEHSSTHSSITQPPVLAQAVEAVDDAEWTKKIFPKLMKFYLYFAENCDPDNDGLISICHPCESGKDASPEFDFLVWRVDWLPRFCNMILRHLAVARIEWEYKKVNWNIQKIWQKDLFNVEELMFHCIWVQGLRSLIRMAKKGDLTGVKSLQYLESLADKAEKAVYDLCWDQKYKIFYSLDSQNRKIKCVTISNLFPLILENIPKEMADALVGHIKNPDKFGTPYPLPSVAVDEPEFDSNETVLIWRGSIWINTVWFILLGLAVHGYKDVANEIARRVIEMIKREGFWEVYHPYTGKGMRVKDFGWSALCITFSKILGLKAV